ncbi:MAG: hypothetical protein KDD76_05445, partial [Rickettsiales bacterium]|nr:hypothetical protein [Rickettsiales bacterium]
MNIAKAIGRVCVFALLTACAMPSPRNAATIAVLPERYARTVNSNAAEPLPERWWDI